MCHGFKDAPKTHLDNILYKYVYSKMSIDLQILMFHFYILVKWYVDAPLMCLKIRATFTRNDVDTWEWKEYFFFVTENYNIYLKWVSPFLLQIINIQPTAHA